MMVGTPWLHCLDCFGASQKIKQCWAGKGYQSVAFDLKLDECQDLSSFQGCLELIRLMLVLPAHYFVYIFLILYISFDLFCFELFSNVIALIKIQIRSC